MNIQKKRFFVYFLILVFGFLGAFFFLKKDESNKTAVVVENSQKKDSLIISMLSSDFIDFEANTDIFVTSEKAVSGKKSCKFSDSIEYGISTIRNLTEFPSLTNLKNISVKFSVLFEKENPDALYVLSIDNKEGKNLFWDGKPIPHNTNQGWSEGTVDFVVPAEFLNSESKLTLFAWNRNKKIFYMDDISVAFIGTTIYQKPLTSESEKSNVFIDFETEASFSNSDNVKETTAHSGKRACDLSGGKEFGFTIKKKISELGTALPNKVSLSMWVYPLTDNPKTVLTASVVDSKNATLFWDGKETEGLYFPKNKWTKINAGFPLPSDKFHPDDVLTVAVWNKGKTDVIIDDIEIVYGESNPRKGEISKVDPISIYEKRFVPVKNKPPFKTIWFEKQEMGNELDAFTPNDLFLVGNFVADANDIDELLCLSKNKQALFTYNISKRAFQKIWENKSANDPLWNPENIYSANIVNGKQSLIVQQKNKTVAVCLNFDGKIWEQTGDQKITAPASSSSSVSIFSGQFTSNKNQILKLDRTWRFDLKLIENDNILGCVDFVGYPNDYNPKYYEFVKLVPGHFLASNQTALLVVMCNCADADFGGERCNQIESLPYLPNKVELYNISPQITQIYTGKN